MPEAPAGAASFVARAWRRSVEMIGLASGTADGAAEESGERKARGWTTDAHRVCPRGIPPRMRVRIKWSP